MILFFKTPKENIIATEIDHTPSDAEKQALSWLYGDATILTAEKLDGFFVGPRREMITPWSTNAVEITQNMSLTGISRIEEYFPVKSEDASHDRMLQRMYKGLDQNIFTVDHQPEPIKHVEDIEKYNEEEGLALSPEEIEYLHKIEKENGRPLTDSEIFGFAQINSEHCRHKIFGGTFIIDGEERPSSLFALIKKTTKEHPGKILSAYKDNVAFAQGPVIEQFAPQDQTTADYFKVKPIESVISLKAETHNFPTTVEPFNGAATGTGGEIRDRMGGGVGSWPIAGTAVYMTSYPRLKNDDGKAARDYEEKIDARKWLYQTPEEILIKASNGASDFGNKFGQPLITGSVLTFEYETSTGDNAIEKDTNKDCQTPNQVYGYDKVIMLAGGVGYGKKRDCLKKEPQPGEDIVVVGGDNYRIGLGGGSVSSVDTGRYGTAVELNAVQRANPEMQKRAYNLVRALVEDDTNPVVSIHDHGSAGHLNCLSELVEDCGGEIDMTKLPIGDKTLSAKEIIANESQERMGLLIDDNHVERVRKMAERERAPFYVVGKTTGDAHFSFVQGDGVKPFDLDVAQMFGHSPKTIMRDETVVHHYEDATYSIDKIDEYLNNVLQLEAVACKDWLTNKVDRSVTGKVARQQTQGQIQLPLSDCGVVALDYRGKAGIATALGHAPQAGLANPAAGSVLSVAELDSPEIHALESAISLEESAETPFTVYEDVRQKLIDAGMPPEQIAFIHDANTEVKKRELFAKVRSGQVRVLMGSTAKMGAGTNVQDRLVALHDLDCPWRPRDLTQRKGRIERQGNQNKLVHVCRYVTEGTFDAYLWQTVENKQKFISQIMTSKSPVRSCEDVDATALSFAEIKALCAGDPRIKERMDLDIEVSKLKIMKADHNSKQFRLEDSLLKYFPEKIEEHKGFVRGLEADMQTLAAHPLPAEGFVGMEIRGDRLTDKENAGAALLDTCKEVKGKDPVQIGSYRGFTMSVAFDSMWKTYTLTLKGQMTHRVELGSDARGNLVRIENALDKMPERLRSVQEQLENLYNQQAAAKAEVGKPFPQEQELAAKTARLIELDMELNLDGKGQPQPEQAIAKSTRPSVLDRLKAPPVHGAPERPHKKEMEAR